MAIRTPRKVATLALVSVTAFGMVACSPPNQQDSEKKVDTATSQNADALPNSGQATQADDAANATATATTTVNAEGAPAYDDCGAVVTSPERITLKCKDQNDFVEGIKWEQWGEDFAKGTGTRNNVDEKTTTPDVEITLSAPEDKDGKLVFTHVTVAGATFNPQSDY